jgi:hypothetical protein
LPCPKPTALQSDSTTISKESDGCSDARHKITTGLHLFSAA